MKSTDTGRDACATKNLSVYFFCFCNSVRMAVRIS